jgi:sugar O-acyltransferase (sialic acid O-acetyltransferase NeuD family)
MMTDLAIYGAGGLGREVALLVSQINDKKKQWKLIGFIDDGKQKGQIIDGLEVLGGIDHINSVKKKIAVVVAIADPIERFAVVSGIVNTKVYFPALIHPSSNTGSSSNTIGRGCIVTEGCIFTTGISLGEFVIVNLATTIGHDAKIAAYCSIMPGCNISGNVSIGAQTLIGTGAQLLQNISIGYRCRVGAGAVVTKSFADRKTIIGVPAKQSKKT